MKRFRIVPVDRFWKYVARRGPDECWDWTGAIHQIKGYGVFQDGTTHRKHVVYAHRFSWAVKHGETPAGQDVHHVCGNKRCVNPAHLRLIPHEQHSGMHRDGKPWGTYYGPPQRVVVEDEPPGPASAGDPELT